MTEYAFPLNKHGGIYANGMSLRDYFAAKALGGFVANPGGPFQANDLTGWSIVNSDAEHIAEECYKLADAMMAEREKS